MGEIHDQTSGSVRDICVGSWDSAAATAEGARGEEAAGS